MSVDKTVLLDSAGFLDAAGTRNWAGGTSDSPQSVVELAGQTGSFVLLAADGAGKTTVLESLRAMEAGPIVINLLALESGGIRDELRRATAAGGPVYLDALEIAWRYFPNLFSILEDFFSAAPAAAVPLRLACRPAAWEGARAAGLDSALPGFRELRLLPLTRASARNAVSVVSSRPEVFLDEAVRAGLGWLAASPLRLLSAATQWEVTGRLPDSQLSGMQYQVEQLLKETSSRQQQTVPDDQRRRLAGRLAAMSVFGLASRFTTSPQPPAGALQVASLPSDSEPDSPEQVTPAEVTEVLGTALFDAAGDATVGFRHQQYAEFLAAEYVVSRRVTRPQVHSLLGMNDDNAIPGPMTGSAAWLAVLRADLGSEFATANAVALAESAVELPLSLREPVVDAILARAAAEDLDELPRQDLAALVYPGLEARLAARISAGVRSSGELWWISRLAQAGRLRQVSARLVWEVLALPWAPWARRAGVAAVSALGDDADVARLEALVRLSPADDPDDDVLAVVIEAVFPRVLDTTALMPLLRPQRNTHYFGPYRILLAELSNRIPTAELPVALSWASAHTADGDDAYSYLLPSLLRRGWDNEGAPGVREPLARLVAAAATSPDRVWRYGHAQDPWRDSPPGPRRELAVLVAACLPEGSYFPLIDLGLLLSSDLGWLLHILPSVAQPEQDALARCVPHLAREPTAAEADLILGMTSEHPAYAHTTWLRGEVSTNSPEAQQARHRVEMEAGIAGRRTTARLEQYSQLVTALRDAAADPRQWHHVARHLAPASPDAGELLSSDLMTRPGWALLDAAQQQQVLDLGLLYLQQHQLRLSSWLGYGSVPPGTFDDAIADWSGAYLLATLARHAPASLSGVPAATWRAWAPAIIGAWTDGSRADRQARRQLTDLLPATERQSLLDAALSNLDAIQINGGRLTTQAVYEHLCPELAAPLAARLVGGRYAGPLGQVLLHILVTHAPRDALPACRLITGIPGHDLTQAARRGLAELDPVALLSQLEGNPVQPDELADLAEHLKLSRLNDSQLAALVRLLLGYVPLASDPPLRLGVYDPEPLDEVRRVRRAVMDLLADHGQSGFFQDLAGQQDDGSRQVTGWYLRRARARASDLSYTGHTPRQLLHLLGQADARLVRNGRDLLDVILLQLEDLQRELTQLGRSRILWDFTGDQGTPKDENQITNEIADRLRPRLNAPGLLDREVEVTPSPRGIGTRIDLKATVPTAAYPAGTASVIIEAKLATNRALRIALTDQLVRQYLIPTNCHHGIYLVYWAKPEQWPGSPADQTALLRELQQQAAEVGSEIDVRPYILDISY